MKKRELNLTSQKGITLIALVITIIVMLILAGVSLAMLSDDNGIVKKATEAKDKTENAMKEEEGIMEGFDEFIQGASGKGMTIEEALAKEPVSKSITSKVTDNLGNKFVVPAGFRIVPNNESDVEYTYEKDASGNSTGNPTVQDGIVIENVTDKNQFVWIPVGNIINDDGSTTNMPLARFEAYGGETPDGFEKAQDATSLLSNRNSVVDVRHENHSRLIVHELVNKAASLDGLPSNQVANDLIGFINSAINNGGFYIARYEAGVEEFSQTKTDDRLYDMQDYMDDVNYDSSLVDYDYSLNWTKYVTSSNATPKVVSKAGYQVWDDVTQTKAAEVSRNMYSSSSGYNTDLANSFAWDTAANFLSTYSGNENYAIRNYGDTDGMKKTGESDDVYCNLFDLSGNYAEWSTENYYGDKNYDDDYEYVSSSILRGGCYIVGYRPVNFTLSRNVNEVDAFNNATSFRPILYVK